MLFGAVGDLHGAFDVLDRIQRRHPEIAFWVCPGDLADDAGEYPTPHAPLYWIKGNNEDFGFVARQPAGGGTLANLHYIPNGACIEVSGFRLAGLGGTFAPTWYETPAAQLPVLKAGKDDRRRHFVHEEVEACQEMSGVDLFLSHEAPRPFPIETRRASGALSRVDAGKTPINDVLAAMHPRLHLFGHHHKYSVSERQHVPSIGLEMATESYLIFDGKTLAHERLKS
jgi:predicted phosphodiesterase